MLHGTRVDHVMRYINSRYFLPSFLTYFLLCVWQCFVDDNQSGFGAKTSSQAELRDTVMALRLREASLVSDMSALKRRLIELETQVCRPQPSLCNLR